MGLFLSFLYPHCFGAHAPRNDETDSLARRANHLKPVQPLCKNLFAFLPAKITTMSLPSRLDERGVRVVTDVGCGMRWMRQCVRRNALLHTAKPCGPDAPTLAFKLVMMSAHH